jgi:subtilisin family serine protease
MNRFGKTFNHSVLILVLFIFTIICYGRETNSSNLKSYVRPDYVPGEVILKLKSVNSNTEAENTLSMLQKDFNVEKFQELLIGNSNKQKRKSRNSNFENIYKAQVPNDINIYKLCSDLNNQDMIEFAEPNYYRYLNSTVPNDSLFNQQWYLHAIRAPQGWDLSQGSRDVIISIVDSGIDVDHPDLVNEIWRNVNEIPDNNIDDDNNGFIDDIIGWDFVNNTNNPNPEPDGIDDDGDGQTDETVDHGTSMAGFASASTNNLRGIAGVSWNCSIMPLQVFPDDGGASAANVAAAILYAAENNADVINLSLGSTNASTLEHIAIKEAVRMGAAVFASAGNDNIIDDHYPSGFPEVICVASTANLADLKSNISNFNPAVDVCAPGGDFTLSPPTEMISTSYYDPEFGFNNIWSSRTKEGFLTSGTSSATALVSGVAGLLFAANPNYTNADVYFQIVGTADDIYDKNPDFIGLLGNGRVNIFRALSEESIQYPKIEFISLSVQDSLNGNNNKKIDLGETVDLVLKIRNTWETARNATLNLIIDDPAVDVINGSIFSNELHGLRNLDKNEYTNLDDPFTISVSPNSVPRTIKAKMQLLADNYEKEFDVSFSIDPRILVIDDDVPGKDGFSKDVENYYFEALEAIDISFDTWDIDFLQEEPHSKKLAPYDIVIWGTEVTNPTLNTNNRAALQNYFEKSGGKAIIFGQDIAWDLADVYSDTNEYNRNTRSKDWFEQFLGASYVSDDGQYNRVNGVEENPITHGMSFNFFQPQRSLLLQNPDVIDTLNGGRAIFTNPQGDVAAVTQSGRSNQGFEWGTIYYAFGGLESIPNELTRQQLLANSINYLNGVQVNHAPVKDVTVPMERDILVNISLQNDTLELEKVELHYTIDGVFPATIIPMDADTADLFKATIPQVESGVVGYQILVKATNGFYAPRIHYSYKIGADKKPPTIEKVKSLTNAIDKVGPFEIISRVDDNLAVNENSVFVHYWTVHTTKDSVKAEKIENSRDYKATIADDFMYGDTLMYYTSAMDVAADPNMAVTSIDTVVIGLEDFENGLVGWEPDSAGTWGVVAEEPFGGFFNLDDSPGATPISDNETILLLKAPLDLSSSDYAVITYAARNMLRPAKDLGYLELSADNGETWTDVAKFSSLKPQWKEYFIPIGEFTGVGFDNVLLRIRLKTKTGDITEKFTGMEIDNIFVREDIVQSVSEENSASALPVDFSLAQNFPNPFNPTTTIEYNVPQNSHVNIEIYNMLGQRIRTLIDQNKSAGNYSIVWNAKDDSGVNVASGMYFYRMDAGDFSALRKLVLLK